MFRILWLSSAFFLIRFFALNACELHRAADLIRIDSVSEEEWSRMKAFYKQQTALPELLRKAILSSRAKSRVYAWEEMSSVPMGHRIAGRRYRIHGRLHSHFTFSIGETSDRVYALLGVHADESGDSSVEGLNTSLLSAMTTFSFLLFRWIEENPEAKELVIQSMRLESESMRKTLLGLGFTAEGSGVKLVAPLVRNPQAPRP